MKKNIVLVLGSLLSFIYPTYAAGFPEGVLDCPVSVQIGEPLFVTVRYSNDSCTDSFDIKRMVRGVAGNSRGSVRLVGPKVITINPPEMVPPATGCFDPTSGGPFNPNDLIPGETSFMVRVSARVPDVFARKAVTVFIEAINDSGRGLGDLLSCVTQVEP
jgi:hypothetical protein